ncbi:hypothetical protein FS749_016188 [Ceratobasidium sp. UAMH 11750]|nr:hypothetical protein FS749_016188 [Ceratobasidium sp. UAMH 11750]
MDTVRPVLVGSATPIFMGVTFVSAYLALSLRPTFIPLVVLLSILITYVRATIKRPGFSHRFFALLSTLCVATVAAFSSSTNSAMSTQYLSSGLLLAVAVLFSLVALAPVLVYANVRSYVGSRSAIGGLLLFPALWTTTWSIFIYLSPLGRLGSWTPMTGIDMYAWMAPVFGQAGVDYITALWGVVIAEYVGQWAMGEGAREELPDAAAPNVDLLTPIVDEVEPTNPDGRRARQKASDQHYGPTPYFLAILFLAMLPSYKTPILPLPAHSPNTTEVTVACIHPYISIPGTAPTLDDYISETLIQGNRAKILLWPEGAIQFRTEAERSTVFEKIANTSTQRNAWIAVGYEQLFTESGETSRGKRVRGHNGLAIFGPKMEPVKYIKRRLVPLVESFSYETALNPPPKYLVPLPKPNYRPKSDKATWPRTIPITAAVCLDVSAPLAPAVPVNHTDEDTGRPALILAPARTWHPEIGKAMFAHASMRAMEQGASILWCDGGEGGVSGIGGLAANGLGPVGGIGQVGTSGSWVQTIGVPFPYDAKDFTSTWYSRWGDLTIIFLAWVVLCAGFTVPAWHGFQTVLAAGRSRLERSRGDEHRRVERNENTPLLVDA